MKRWRMEYLKRIGYDGSEYARPELKWAERSFMQPQMMMEDRFFYDPVAGRYTVDRYLDDWSGASAASTAYWSGTPIRTSASITATSSIISKPYPVGLRDCAR